MVTTNASPEYKGPLLELRDRSKAQHYKLYLRGEPVPLGALATKVGVDFSFMSRVFSDTEHERKWIPGMATAAKISKALDVSLEELYEFLRSLGKSV